MLLIDGDILVYQAISSAEKELEFEPDLWVMYCDHGEAKGNFLDAVANITRLAEDDDVVIALSDPKANWRKLVYPSYKSNRKNTRKPMGFIEFRQWVMDNHKTVMKPTLEADDVLGILATKPKNNAIVWSIDKDLKQIPGRHLTKEGVITITEEEADYWHMRQTLTGDAVDGYPGCPGVGPVKAHDLLKGDAPAWQIVTEAYAKAKLTEDDALTQARIARILRWTDWNQEKQEVIPWTPK